MKKKVILDVDTGVDDALGILLAVRSGKFDVLAITTVNGNVSRDQATINTCKILQLLGCEESIPVYKGADRPLLRESFFEHRVHGQDGIGGALSDMPVHMKPSEGFAPDVIIEAARRYPGELTLVATGPLTNVALAVRKAPELVDLIKEVVVMGGVVASYGNVTPTAEYNMYVDPEAAKVVFHAGFPSLTLVGLDVTRKALLTKEHMEQMGDSPIVQYIRESTTDYMKRYYERNGIHACVMHDPLAVGVALNRDIVTTRRYYVDVETRSDLCDGQTVCDFQNRLSKQANMDVCMDVDTEAFLQLFTQTMKA